MERLEIMIAGRGGQGILLAGYLLGLTLIKHGYYVVQSESYSAETRGGDSRSELIVLKEQGEADYMRVRRADIAVFMYGEQLRKYSDKVRNDALVIVDSTFIKPEELREGWRSILIPFSRIAEEQAGTIRVANIVMLGALARITGLYTLDELKETIQRNVKPGWIELNLRAAELGYKVAEEHGA